MLLSRASSYVALSTERLSFASLFKHRKESLLITGIHFPISPFSRKQKGQPFPCGINWPAFKRVAPKGLLSNGPTGYLNIEGSGFTRLLKKSHVVILRSLRRQRISIFLLQILRVAQNDKTAKEGISTACCNRAAPPRVKFQALHFTSPLICHFPSSKFSGQKFSGRCRETMLYRRYSEPFLIWTFPKMRQTLSRILPSRRRLMCRLFPI